MTMIEAQESLKNLETGIVTALNTIQSLTHAKQVLSSHISRQKSLVQENKSLESVVKDLRNEKLQLELEVQETRKNLQSLQRELKETNNAVLNNNATHRAVTPATCEHRAKNGDCTVRSELHVSGNYKERLEIKHDDGKVYHVCPEQQLVPCTTVNPSQCKEKEDMKQQEILEASIVIDKPELTSYKDDESEENEQMNHIDAMCTTVVDSPKGEAVKQPESLEADDVSIAMMTGYEDEDDQMSDQLVLCTTVESSKGEEKEASTQPAQSESNEAIEHTRDIDAISDEINPEQPLCTTIEISRGEKKASSKQLEFELEADEAEEADGCKDDEINEDDQVSEQLAPCTAVEPSQGEEKEALKQPAKSTVVMESVQSEVDELLKEANEAIAEGTIDGTDIPIAEDMKHNAPSIDEAAIAGEKPEACCEDGQSNTTPPSTPKPCLTSAQIERIARNRAAALKIRAEKLKTPPPKTNTVTGGVNEDEQMSHIDVASDENQPFPTPHSVSITPRRLIFEMPLQCDEVDKTTNFPDVLKKAPIRASTSTHKRYTARKWYWSPKRWRRIVQNNRLQSFFIENIN